MRSPETRKIADRPFYPFNRWRIGALIVVIIGSLLLAFWGKQHLLVFENMEHYEGGQALEAFEVARVSLSGGEILEIEEEDYAEVRFVGPWSTIRVEVERNGRTVAAEKRVYLGFKEYFEFNIPQFVNEAPVD